jgi:hypothetical protein
LIQDGLAAAVYWDGRIYPTAGAKQLQNMKYEIAVQLFKYLARSIIQPIQHIQPIQIFKYSTHSAYSTHSNIQSFNPFNPFNHAIFFFFSFFA